MSLSEIFSKKLLVVSGKGGVGKTTLSLALALVAAEKGKRVLVAEINSEEQIAQLLQRPPIGYREVDLLPGLWAINVKPQESFKEYVLMQIKIRVLYRAVFENRLVRNFLDGTPGLSELMTIGKIYSLVDRYDLIVLDAPSTGHALSLLEIARIASSAIRVGPLKTHAEKIDALLHDAARTLVVSVTLPEEMPVTETLEFRGWLKDRVGLALGPIFINQIHPTQFSARERREIESLESEGQGEDSLIHALKLQMVRAERSEHYVRTLRGSLPTHPLVPIPFIYSSQFGLSEIERIAEILGDWQEEAF